PAMPLRPLEPEQPSYVPPARTAVSPVSVENTPEYRLLQQTLERQKQQTNAQATELLRLKEQLAELERREQEARARSRSREQEQDITRLRNQVSYLEQRLKQQPAPATSPTLEDMKRTLVVMNEKYDKLAEENRRLKDELKQANSAKPAVVSDSQQLNDLKKQ